MSSYGSLARFYDSLTGNVDYVRRADFVVEEIGATNSKTILDAGCGTGSISRMLLDRGFDVIGVDNSPEMLSAAREKNPEQLLLCQDLTDLDLYGTVQGIVCFQDTLNHLKDLDSVERVIDRFSLFLESGCCLIFDINTLNKYCNVQSDNTFVLENEEVICIWRNHFNPSDSSMLMRLDLFSSDNGYNYIKETETIREIYIPDKWMVNSLVKNSFDIENIIDGDTYGPVRDDSERIMYVTRRR